MNITDYADIPSDLKGYAYYKEKRIRAVREVAPGIYEALADGAADHPYEVRLNINAPRASSCSCPRYQNSRDCCKHMVALFFTLFPDEAEAFEERRLSWAEDGYDFYLSDDDDFPYDAPAVPSDLPSPDKNSLTADTPPAKRAEKLRPLLADMNREALQAALAQVLANGPEWQYRKFLSERNRSD